jgi:hypothetical protein
MNKKEHREAVEAKHNPPWRAMCDEDDAIDDLIEAAVQKQEQPVYQDEGEKK